MRKEAVILADELGKLGGTASKWIFRLLPMSEAKQSFIVKMDAERAKSEIKTCLEKLGVMSKDLSTNKRLSAVVGSGVLGLNPSILHVYFKLTDSGVSINVHALAKEGLIKQGTALKAVKAFVREFGGSNA